MAGPPQGQEPCRAVVPVGRAFAAQRSVAAGRVPEENEGKLGPAGATTATAHKIAVIFYTMVKNQVEYDATLWAQRDACREQRIDAALERQARRRGKVVVFPDQVIGHQTASF